MANKPSKKLDYKDGSRTGIKVSWRYYRSREDAEAASIAARHNAEIQAGLGYDFGYCWPGSIELVRDDGGLPEFAGMWVVCIP